MIIAVIGAGISGLVTARELLKSNYAVMMIEKSVSIGGRLATRRVGVNDGQHLNADTGAQFITARSQIFKEKFILPGLEGDYIHVWNHGGFNDTNLTLSQNPSLDKHPRYSSKFGLNAAIQRSFADVLSHPNCNTLLNTRVKSIFFSQKDNLFSLELENDQKVSCTSVFVSLPLPQAIPLIQNIVTDGNFTCSIPNASDLLSMKAYDPCLCLIVIIPSVLSRTIFLNQNGAKKLSNDPIMWMASNNSKGMGMEGQESFDSITLHCNAKFSAENYNLSDKEISQRILEASLLSTYREQIISMSVKKWKFAVPLISVEGILENAVIQRH